MQYNANIIAIKKANTSNDWYWIKLSSLAGLRRCAAPLCRITYSDQKIALSNGLWGWSLIIFDNCCTLSENLDKIKK